MSCLSSSKNNSELEKVGRNQLERHEKTTRMVGRRERMSMDVVRKWFVDISVHCTHQKRSTFRWRGGTKDSSRSTYKRIQSLNELVQLGLALVELGQGFLQVER
jgi:hypothetical protein